MEITAQIFYETLEKLACQNLKPWKLTYFSFRENFLSLCIFFFPGESDNKMIRIYDLC